MNNIKNFLKILGFMIKKFTTSILIIIALLLNISCGAEDNNKESTKTISNNLDKIVATYKNKEIKESEVIPYLATFVPFSASDKGKKLSEFPPEIQESLIKEYVRNKLLEEEITKANIESSKDAKSALKTLENQVKVAKRQILVQELLKKNIQSATEDDIKKEYQKLAQQYNGKDQVQISHILVKDESKAKEIREKLKKGKASFENLAKESLDEETKSKGGLINDYIIQNNVPPEFGDKLFAMKVGEISEPIKTQMGWEILKLNDKKKFQLPSIETIKPSIIARLNNMAADKYLNSLYDSANVKIIEIKQNSQEPVKN